MVDRATTFTELPRRNAVRREAKLPLLDMRAEFDHEVEVAAWREACVKHADDMARIEIEVLAYLHGAMAMILATRSVGIGQSVSKCRNDSAHCWPQMAFTRLRHDSQWPLGRIGWRLVRRPDVESSRD